jgi:5-methylcytosine-specific restriction enzyme subunit McrC
MNSLRTVTVLEHEVIPVVAVGDAPDAAGPSLVSAPWLTEGEARHLLRLNDQRSGFCQAVPGGVKLAKYCGIARLGTCVLEVLPKIGMADFRVPAELDRARGALLRMLSNAREMSITTLLEVPQQAVHAPLLDIFIEAFLKCALEQARRGLLSRYVPHHDDLPVMKGRFHAHGHIRNNMGRPHLLSCEYDEFTADNAYNRAIRATLDACFAWVSGVKTRRLWFETQTRYSGVPSLRTTTVAVAQLPRDRTTHRYEPVLKWCEWLLATISPAMKSGGAHAPGLLFDMNKLFEAHVSSLEERDAGNSYIVHRQGPTVDLATSNAKGVFALRPDVTVWRRASDGSASAIAKVVDAKWKRLGPGREEWLVDQSDIYQMLAYALKYRCQRAELVYPALGNSGEVPEKLPIFEISNPALPTGRIEIRIKTVPLWG